MRGRRLLKSPADQQGFILIPWVIITFLVLSALFTYVYSSHLEVNVGVREVVHQQAMALAQSAMTDARTQLKRGDLQQWLPPGSSQTTSGSGTGTRYEATLYRSGTDSSLVDIYATGYYYLSGGNLVDPFNQQPAQAAVIHGKVRITDASAYMLAVPNTLSILPNADFSQGALYAKDLVFVQGAVSTPNTLVGAGYYFNSVTPSAAPSFVTFLSTPPAAQQLTTAPAFPSLDSTMRAQYQNWAGGTINPDFSGTVPAPPGHVYFVNGSLHIGQNGPLVVSGVYVIYATNDIYIDNNITNADANSWAAFMTEGSIHVSTSAPDNLTLMGNYFTDNTMSFDGPSRSVTSQFTIQGGVTCLQNFSAGTVYAHRNYWYASSSDPNLLLPFITELLQFETLLGKV